MTKSGVSRRTPRLHLLKKNSQSTQHAACKVPDREEWDFEDKGRLPDRELNHCLYYEYAREQASASARWRALFADIRDAHGKGAQRHMAIHKSLRAVFGDSPVWQVFYEERLLTAPWQNFSADERKRLCKVGKIPNLESFTKSIALNVTLARDLPEYAAAGATDFASWRLLDRRFHTEQAQREHGFLAVNWDYTDDVLREQFRTWLDEKRGERKAVTSQQGKSKPRQFLKALGAKRLLDAGLSVPDAQAHTMGFLKDKEGHPRALFEAERTWYDAKLKTVPEILAKLFSACGPREEDAST